MVSLVRSLVDKAEESWDTTPKGPGSMDDEPVQTIACDLSARLTRSWASLYEKHNSPGGLTDLIGKSLKEYERNIS